jgi:hypothetical protein
VLNRKMLAVIGGAFALALAAVQPALAQDYPQSGRNETDRAREQQQQQPQQQRPSRTREQRPAPAPTPEQNIAAAQAVLTSAGRSCQVTEAVSPGVTAEQARMYEAACATGPGYIAVASTPPTTVDCFELAGTAAAIRRRDPAADVGPQCTLPANQNALAVIGGWAREAGVTCTVDEALAAGKSDAGTMIYEVGCAGVDGYRLEKTDAGWDLVDCFRVVAGGATCRFTTPEEQIATIAPKLAGTEAAACDITQARWIGNNPAGDRFYEVKCGVGEGYVAKINAAGETQEAWTCAGAALRRVNCTLTPVAAVAPAPTE